MRKSILIGQSEGPTAVINASLYGVITEGKTHPKHIDAVCDTVNGIEDFLSGRCMDLSQELIVEDLLLSKQTPAVHLGSCRHKLPKNLDVPTYGLLFEKFTSLGIGACLYIGGNDPMGTADKLSRCVRLRHKNVSFTEVPRTINNDLPVTDYTPGYGSAVKYMISTVREIYLDTSVYRQPAVITMKLIGRHIGWVTATSVPTRKHPGDNPPLIYMPGVPFDVEQFSEDVKDALDQQPNVVICISESIRDKHGKFICEYANEASLDTLGRKMFTGSAKLLESYVRNRLHIKARSMELNVNQRCNSLLASVADVHEAVLSGRTAIQQMLGGATGCMVACSRRHTPSYGLEYELTDVCNVCNKEGDFLVDWVAQKDVDISPQFLEYVLPLIAGKPERITELDLPKYLSRSRKTPA